MGAPVSVDLRQRAVQAVLKEEGSCRQIAVRFAINHTSLSRWVKQFKETNTVEPKKGPGRKFKLGEDEMNIIFDIVEKNPDATIHEIKDKFNELSPIHLQPSSIHNYLVRLGLTRKKNGLRSRT